MRGTDAKSRSLFSYVDLEQRVPAKHPLRVIKSIVDEVLVSLDGAFDKLYEGTGRQSIAPERLLQASLLQAFYSVRSERQLMEQIDYNLLFRWFVGLGIDDPVHSTFSKNRDRLLDADVAARFLEAHGSVATGYCLTEAVGLMKTAWGAVEDRRLEQTEVIDIRPHDELADLWSPFIHSHHYDVQQSLYTSWLARHPRRTCEAAWQQFMECQYLGDHPFPPGSSLTDMQAWIAPMVAAEDS